MISFEVNTSVISLSPSTKKIRKLRSAIYEMNSIFLNK